jgi:predicted DCC family thiol-disulfide oxidoreductase YuxK
MTTTSSPGSTRLERAQNGWTGGQYSLLRVLFSCSAVLYAADAWLGQAEGTALQRWGAVGLIALVALPLALGTLDKLAAISLSTLLMLHRFLTPTPELLVAWPAFESLLLLHAFTPRAPYGAWSARGRPDPGGGWHLSDRLHDIAWLVVGLSHLLAGLASASAMSWSLNAEPWVWVGVTIHLAFLPLAVWRSGRPVALALGLLSLAFGPVDGSLILAVTAHLACFTPAWLASASGPREILFYDGACGLCHRAVRFCLAEDRGGRVLVYAPLQSATFEARVAEEVRATLPDSLVLLTAEGEVLLRTDAVIRCLLRLGGLWRLFGWSLRCWPRPLRDVLYDLVAAARHRVFAAPKSACPIVPADLRDRFKVPGNSAL